MRIPKIFLSSKSDNFKSFKPYFESINWLVKVFYSSSFFGEFLFLILSHTEISTDFYPWVPAVHFAPHPRAIATPQKLVLVGGLPKKLDFVSPSLWTAPKNKNVLVGNYPRLQQFAWLNIHQILLWIQIIQKMNYHK